MPLRRLPSDMPNSRVVALLWAAPGRQQALCGHYGEQCVEPSAGAAGEIEGP